MPSSSIGLFFDISYDDKKVGDSSVGNLASLLALNVHGLQITTHTSKNSTSFSNILSKLQEFADRTWEEHTNCAWIHFVGKCTDHGILPSDFDSEGNTIGPHILADTLSKVNPHTHIFLVLDCPFGVEPPFIMKRVWQDVMTFQYVDGEADTPLPYPILDNPRLIMLTSSISSTYAFEGPHYERWEGMDEVVPPVASITQGIIVALEEDFTHNVSNVFSLANRIRSSYFEQGITWSPVLFSNDDLIEDPRLLPFADVSDSLEYDNGVSSMDVSGEDFVTTSVATPRTMPSAIRTVIGNLIPFGMNLKRR